MLTTLATVKARLKLAAEDVVDDALLTGFLKSISARLENDCNRTFGYAVGTVDEFEADETELRVSHYPIDETGAIAVSRRVSSVEGWVVQTGADWVVRKGCVISLTSVLGNWKQQIRVSYSGGYLLPGTAAPQGTAPVALPDDIEQAAVEQVCYLYQNKDRLGVTGMTGQGGGFQQFSKLDLLPSVQAVVSKYERWMA